MKFLILTVILPMILCQNMTSRIRLNFHNASEKALNEQINMELHASYVYMSMSNYFNRDDVALKGFKDFFDKQSDEEREHAKKFIDYVHLRGGAVCYQKIEKPFKDEWGSPLEALEAALQLEKTVYESLLKIHKIASQNEDPHLTDWLEGNMLNEQVESIYNLSHHITNVKRCGPNLGEYIFDKETLQ